MRFFIDKILFILDSIFFSRFFIAIKTKYFFPTIIFLYLLWPYWFDCFHMDDPSSISNNEIMRENSNIKKTDIEEINQSEIKIKSKKINKSYIIVEGILLTVTLIVYFFFP